MAACPIQILPSFRDPTNMERAMLSQGKMA